MAKVRYQVTGNLMGGEGMRFKKGDVVELEEKEVEKFVQSKLLVPVEKSVPLTPAASEDGADKGSKDAKDADKAKGGKGGK